MQLGIIPQDSNFKNIAAEYYIGIDYKYNQEAALDATMKVKKFLAKHLK